MRCALCGSEEVEPGFVEDGGDHSHGFARWVEGPLAVGLFGRAKRFGRLRRRIEAWRCTQRGRLELFAREQA
ncbi:hypothetical protein [Actinocorallia aurea]